MAAAAPPPIRCPLTGRRPGFTILEILIVLAIMGVMAGAAALSLGGNDDREDDATVKRLSGKLQYAIDAALTGDRYLAFVPDTKSGYHFLAWDPRKEKWVGDPGPELSDDPKLTRDDGRRGSVQLAGLGSARALQFRPAGESDSFSLVLSADDQVWNIVSDGFNVTETKVDAR